MMVVDFHDEDEWSLNGGEGGDEQRARGNSFFF